MEAGRLKDIPRALGLSCNLLLGSRVSCDLLSVAVSGDDVTVDMEKDVLTNNTTGKTYNLKPIGEVSRGKAGLEQKWWGLGMVSDYLLNPSVAALGHVTHASFLIAYMLIRG